MEELLKGAIKHYIKTLERKKEHEYNPMIKQLIQTDIDLLKNYTPEKKKPA